MILTFEFDLDCAKVNHRAVDPDQRSSIRKLSSGPRRTDIHATDCWTRTTEVTNKKLAANARLMPSSDLGFQKT